MALKAANLEARKATWQKIVISSTGENTLNFLHPSTASRLRKIEHALEKQNIEIDKLKNFLDETNLKLENKLKKLGKFGLIKAMINRLH